LHWNLISKIQILMINWIKFILLSLKKRNYQSVIHGFESTFIEANLNECSKKKASSESSHLQKLYFELQEQYQTLLDQLQAS
jgi:hypothetical protein